MTAAANVGHAWNVNSASGICKISAKQMLDQESIFFLQPTMDYGHTMENIGGGMGAPSKSALAPIWLGRQLE